MLNEDLSPYFRRQVFFAGFDNEGMLTFQKAV